MMQEAIMGALNTLNDGGTILYPTETVPGLGCDARNVEAVQKVIDLKGRASNKGFIVLLDDDRKLHNYMREVPDVAWDLTEHSTEPLTIIYPDGKNVAPAVLADDGSIAIRITTDPFCKALIRKFGRAIVSTSANQSGMDTPKLMKDVVQSIRSKVDHIVVLPEQAESTESRSTQSSKIIKLALNGEIQFIRH